ncbi:MAG: transketolase [Alphaproteobacteria bacterium]|nr:MAG: transketolase [Alphaproteobacteria bacterium]
MANALRQLSADMVEQANSGHPGMPLGMADIMTVLMTKHLQFYPQDPLWPNRDRLIVSNGHGSALLYSTLHLLGYKEISMEEIQRFRQLGSLTAGHPEYHPQAGIETTTGPLGQGFANAVGVALSAKILAARLGNDTINYHTYVFAGDGCLMEGINHEAASLAGHLILNNLVVIFDDNHITIDGSTALSTSENTCARYKAYGWDVLSIDGHDLQAIDEALTRARTHTRPTLIAARTSIGKCSPTKEGSHKIHGSPLGKDELTELRKRLGVSKKPFHIHPAIRTLWEEAGLRYADMHKKWCDSHEVTLQNYRVRVQESLTIDCLNACLRDLDTTLPRATRQTSQDVLEKLAPHLPHLIGGSADLTASNNTKTGSMLDITSTTLNGTYINFGIREHAMAAIMNGLSLSSDFVPYGGTFLVFSDYLRPALRLSALMKIRVIYVFTHDSIGLGEDGPTHQPVEHLASLRAIPNLQVFRPADLHETKNAWVSALAYKGPTALILSRQPLPQLDRTCAQLYESMSVFHSQDLPPCVTLLATGSEVSLALAVQEKLRTDCIGSTVISVPNKADLEALTPAKRTQIIPQDSLCVVIEAARATDWYDIIGRDGIVCGVPSFGASAPLADIYAQVGLTVPTITEKIRNHPAMMEP